jgi:hypothetical protein
MGLASKHVAKTRRPKESTETTTGFIMLHRTATTKPLSQVRAFFAKEV